MSGKKKKNKRRNRKPNHLQIWASRVRLSRSTGNDQGEIFLDKRTKLRMVIKPGKWESVCGCPCLGKSCLIGRQNEGFANPGWWYNTGLPTTRREKKRNHLLQ